MERGRQGKGTDFFSDRLAEAHGTQTKIAMGFAEQFSDIHSGHNSERQFDASERRNI
ncbi:MAG TPA: hypothetical protein VM680_20750 [Verrucomicrobiae bacterium]|nr:hypothetical protein [Verrucomicrobiae bacterium]